MRSGIFDQLLEQAVVWASGGGHGTATVEDSSLTIAALGLDGSDLVDYNAFSERADTSADFTPGDDGDFLDLHDFPQDPGTSNPADFDADSNSTVLVDVGGGLQLTDSAADNLL